MANITLVQVFAEAKAAAGLRQVATKPVVVPLLAALSGRVCRRGRRRIGVECPGVARFVVEDAGKRLGSWIRRSNGSWQVHREMPGDRSGRGAVAVGGGILARNRHRVVRCRALLAAAWQLIPLFGAPQLGGAGRTAGAVGACALPRRHGQRAALRQYPERVGLIAQLREETMEYGMLASLGRREIGPAGWDTQAIEIAASEGEHLSGGART